MLVDDGLPVLEMGNWNIDKYALVENYADIFAQSMKKIWQCRVFINLFSGPGRSRFRESGEIVESAALLALRIQAKFDKYIYCDISDSAIAALQKRITSENLSTNSAFIQGDVNTSTDRILKEIPQHRDGFKVLSFCFIDPFRMENLAFSTIKQLSTKFMDFLILLPTYMDANRNPQNYESSSNTCVENFLGDKNWRDNWNKVKSQGMDFGHFIFDSFAKQMHGIDYQVTDLGETSVLVRNTAKKAPLYQLAFFSRHERGIKLFREAKRYSTQQTSLFDGDKHV